MFGDIALDFGMFGMGCMPGNSGLVLENEEEIRGIFANRFKNIAITD